MVDRPTQETLGESLIRHELMLCAAEERWPEIVCRGEPHILPVGGTIATVTFPVLEGSGWFGKEIIELEQVGDFAMGYSPKWHALAVRKE